MDTTAVRLADVTPANTEVIGLNGKLAGHCGYSLPVVRHKPTGLCCVLSYARKPAPAWSPESVIREMEVTGRITRLERPLRLPPHVVGQTAQQPLVTWADSYLVLASRTPVPPPGADHLRLPADQVVFCATQGEADDLLLKIARFAQFQFDLFLASPDPNWPGLARTAEVGLQAARDSGLRYWMYARRGVALYFSPASPPELAYQLFRTAIEPTYKGTTWARFLEAMGVIHDRARALRLAAILPAHAPGMHGPVSGPPVLAVPPEWLRVYVPGQQSRWPQDALLANPPYWQQAADRERIQDAAWGDILEQIWRTSHE